MFIFSPAGPLLLRLPPTYLIWKSFANPSLIILMFTRRFWLTFYFNLSTLWFIAAFWASKSFCFKSSINSCLDFESYMYASYYSICFDLDTSNSQVSYSFLRLSTSFSFFIFSNCAKRSATLPLAAPFVAAFGERSACWLSVLSYDGFACVVALSFEAGPFFEVCGFFSFEVSLVPFFSFLVGDLLDLWLFSTGGYFCWISSAARSWWAYSFKAVIYLSFCSFTSCRLSMILSCISLSFFIISQILSLDSSFCSYWFTYDFSSFIFIC